MYLLNVVLASVKTNDLLFVCFSPLLLMGLEQFSCLGYLVQDTAVHMYCRDVCVPFDRQISGYRASI